MKFSLCSSNSPRRRSPEVRFNAVSVLLLWLASEATLVRGFATTVFQDAKSTSQVPSIKGVGVGLPDFDKLFDGITHISPLAKSVVQRHQYHPEQMMTPSDTHHTGLKGISDTSGLPWKMTEKNKKKNAPFSTIEKIDNFQGHHAPLIRFRSSFEGPCIGQPFANFIMEYKDRVKWDAQLETVYEIQPLNHDEGLQTANLLQGFKYGECTKLGVGYVQTKPNGPITAREQLTLCGIQDFEDGSVIIWGVECDESQNFMLPGSQRHTRAKSHIFSTTLTPTSDRTFDVEYCLQLEIGGKLPTWLTTPVCIENIKKCFRCAQNFYSGKNGELEAFIREEWTQKPEHVGLLMTP